MKRFGLSSQERIKSRKEFQKIYSSGKTFVSLNKIIKALYIIDKNATRPGVKIAAAVSVKSGNAVWRNRFKRIIKESFRLNKENLLNISIDKNILVEIVFSPNLFNQKKEKRIYLKSIMPEVLDILLKIQRSI